MSNLHINRRDLLFLGAAGALLPKRAQASNDPGLPFWTALATTFVAWDIAVPDSIPAASRYQTPEDFGRELQSYLYRQPPTLRDPLFIGLRILRWWGVWRGKFKPLEALTQEEREIVVDSWLRSWISPFQSVAMVMRSTAGLLWYADPVSWQKTGYDGPWILPTETEP